MFLKVINGRVSFGQNRQIRAYDKMPINYALERDYPDEEIPITEENGVDVPTIKSDINTNINNIGSIEQPSGMEGGRVRLPVVRNKKVNKFISMKF